MRIHGGDIERIPEGIDFSSNLNPYAPPHRVTEIFQNPDPRWWTTHPQPYPQDLEKRLAERLHLDPQSLVLLPGSTYGIHAAFQVFNPQRAVIPHPTFNEYRRVAQALNIPVYSHRLKEENSFRLCLGELASVVEEEDLIFVCNPNNPTGYFFGTDEMEGLLRWCEVSRSSVVFDEAFIDFTPHAEATAEAAQKSKRCIVIRSLTKIFSIPGVRLGYAIAHPETAAKLRDLVPSWSINRLACKVLEALIEAMDEIPKWRRRINEEKNILIRELSSLGLKPFPSSANFLLVKAEGRSAEQIKSALMERGILIRTFPEYPDLSEFFRVSVRNRQENKKLIEALREVL